MEIKLCNIHRATLITYFLININYIVSVRSVLQADATFRLPSSILPIQYNLTIEPNIAEGTFNGSVIIKLKVVEKTNKITLHSKNLTLTDDNIVVRFSNNITAVITSTMLDNVRDFYTIILDKDLTKHEVLNLHINNFTGELKFDNFGFYLAKYLESEQEKILALTDFQPHGAREAFPCFDEPALKATFLISIVRQNNFTSLSNGNLVRTTYLGAGRFRDDFEETVPMSTYIVAFSVSKYEHTAKNGLSQIHIKADAIRNDRTEYALSTANDILNTLENFTNIPYTMSKLDLFGVPSDYFEPGGMENWGLITISEKHLECSEESTLEEIQKCTMLLAHEIAHQWFGNLVTPTWWNYFWLSEGFCTYMEYFITSLINPSWEVMNVFAVNLYQPILKTESFGVQALNYNLQYAGTLPSSNVAYLKGAAILRMLVHILTPAVFKLGISIYLEKHKYSSVTPHNLYEAFQQAVDETGNNERLGLKVDEIMKSWESYPGYPLVEVVRNYSDASVTIVQKYSGRASKNKNLTWAIPINYACSNDIDFTSTVPKLWLTNESLLVDNVPVNCSWIVVNIQQTGCYRVNYDLQNWERLINFLRTPNFNHIHVLNRAQLIDDSFALADSNELPYDTFLNLSLYLSQETHYTPITSFLRNVGPMVNYFTYIDKLEIVGKYIERSLSGVYQYLGFDPKPSDHHLDKLNRITLITWLCSLGNVDCQEHSSRKLRNWIQNGSTIFKDLEFPILCSSLKIGTADEWQFVYREFKKEEHNSRKLRLFASLGCTRKATLLNKFLDTLLDPDSELTIDIRSKSLKNVLFLDNDKAEMILQYFFQHQTTANEMYSKIKFVDTVCTKIVRKHTVELIHLTQTNISQNSLIQNCVSRIFKNYGNYQQLEYKRIIDWLEINFAH